jgi:tetratricopeptide (TPR) repeat protein
MSPEQTQGMPLDARSDVYSFGLVLHELLAGERSFGEREPGKSESAPASLGEEVPAELRAIVAKALEPEPADRYQTMRDLVVDLRRLARRSGVGTSLASDALETTRGGTGPVVPPQRFVERRLLYWVAGLGLLIVAGFVVREARFGDYPATSVALLPFVTETADPADAAITEGIGDALRDRLMTLPGLSVQARASSTSFRGQGVDIPTIADTLEVGRLINGSVRRTGRTLEVVVEVLDARGFALQPALRFQGAETGLQAMQQEIAAQVSKLLVPEAESAVAAAPATPTSASEKANLLVLFGTRAERQVKEALTVDEVKLAEAIDFYRQATVADPNSVAAHARLAGSLLYLGDTEGARAPLEKAIDLGRAIEPGSAAAELSDAYFATAQFLLRTRSTGIEAAYQQAIELNPNNADALGAYAQWLMAHGGTPEADHYFREAKRLDRRSLSRYQDHAELLGIVEDMQAVRDVGDDILNRFPDDPRAYLALARIHEITGDLDVGIAWGLKALRLQPDDGQIGELYARIGLFDEARELDPEPRMYLSYYRRRYDELVDLAQESVIEYPGDILAWYMLAFAYNATGDFSDAKYILEAAGIEGVLPGAEYMVGSADNEAVTTYVDALQGLDPNDSRARELAQLRAGVPGERVFDAEAPATGVGRSWWVNVGRACAFAQLGQYPQALDLLDRVKNAQGLVRSPLVQDSPCFKPLAGEARYKAVVDRLEERKQLLRERLPATLLEHGVADVRPGAAL